MPPDIGPNPKFNTWTAVLISLVSALPLYLGLHAMTFLPPDQWGFSYICLGIVAVNIACAAWIWRSAPMCSASVTFREGGFHLTSSQLYVFERQFDMRWSEIDDIDAFNGGLYGGRSFIIRNQAQGKASFSAAWVDVPSGIVLERLTESAALAGFTLEKAPMSLATIWRTRWKVQPTT